MLRLDADGIPTVVQEWEYVGGRSVRIALFNGRVIYADLDVVRDGRAASEDSRAIDEHVSKWLTLIMRQHETS